VKLEQINLRKFQLSFSFSFGSSGCGDGGGERERRGYEKVKWMMKRDFTLGSFFQRAKPQNVP
jgi:hypothetical protein